MLKPEFDPDIQLVETSGGVQLSMSMDRAWITEQKRRLVTSAILGFAAISNLPFEDVDGTALRIERDYSGHIRNSANPSPGPFEYSTGGAHTWNLLPAQR